MACELIGRNFQWHFLQINEKLLLEAAKGRPRLAQIIREVAAIVKVFQASSSCNLLEVFGDREVRECSQEVWGRKKINMAANANARGWPRSRAASNAGKYMTGPQGIPGERTVRL